METTVLIAEDDP